jgi:MYXO-CTERM domain-containing protein
MSHETSSSTSRPRRSGRLAAFVGLTVTAAAWVTPAHASTAYAYLLSSGFDFGGGCPACHTNEAGGLGTVTKPFGMHMMTLGLVANNTDSLYQAVSLLSESDHDSDGDTISDFDELSPDGDPNDSDVFPEDATPVIPAPPPPATSPPATSPPPATTTEPTTTSAPTAPPGTPPPAPSPSPAPASSGDGGGCRIASSNGSPLSAAILAMLGFVLFVRRRR